ncbi:hypothetical protein HPP92_014823 [Vanilla planifolia]|uniref:Uncharacterized protein n=1 Tax=Vanilla planifolia TaxID=51239 RepID=A0A835QL57_VANPL|nr:hypothetical protein HPP92_014823 [Vanilla planifolia]
MSKMHIQTTQASPSATIKHRAGSTVYSRHNCERHRRERRSAEPAPVHRLSANPLRLPSSRRWFIFLLSAESRPLAPLTSRRPSEPEFLLRWRPYSILPNTVVRGVMGPKFFLL